MKKYFAMFLLFVIALFAFGQTTDSTAVVTYNFGDSFMEFLKTNLWTLVFVVLYFVSELIGENPNIPEGSIWRKVLNFLLTLARKKATESPKMAAMKMKYAAQLKAEAKEPVVKKESKGKVAKMIMIAVLLSSFTLGASAQTFKGMLKPVTTETIRTVEMQKQLKSGSDTIADASDGVLIARFGATVLGAKTNYRSDIDGLGNGGFVTEPFSRSGFGVTFSHFSNVEGEVFNNYGFGGYLLFPVTTDPTQQFMSVMLDVSALELFNSFTFNIGIGYDINKALTVKENFFVSPGVKITF